MPRTTPRSPRAGRSREAIALADRILIMRDGRIGSEHRVELGSQDRTRGLAREELRADLLLEIGVSSGG